MKLIASACRVALVLMALLPGLSQRAWAQRELVLPRGEIGQILAAKQARDAQLNALVEDYRQRLRTELVFVQRACELTPEQAVALEKHGEEIVERAKEQFSDAIENQRADRRLVVVNNRRLMVVGDRVVAVAGAAARDEFSTLQLAMAEDVDEAVRQTLPDHIAARLTAERQRISEKVKAAKIRCLAAAMDEILFLTDKQREQLCSILASLWNEKWGPIVVALDRASLTSAAKLSAPLRAKSCGVGGAFDLPDALLEPLLRPAQLTMWKEMRKPLDARMAGLQAELLNARLARAQGFAGIALPGNAQIRRDIILRRMRVNVGQPAQQPAAQAKPASNEQDEASVNLSPGEIAQLDVLIDSMIQTCELPPAVSEKLQWAGKLDLFHKAERMATRQREIQQQAAQALVDIPVEVLAESAAPCNLLADEASLLRKLTDSRVSAEQRQHWSDSQRQRLEFQRQIRVEFIVLSFSQRSPLTAAQWDALARLINDRLGELPADAAPDRLAVNTAVAIARIPDAEFKPLFDEVQWPAISRRLQDLRLEAPLIKP